MNNALYILMRIFFSLFASSIWNGYLFNFCLGLTALVAKFTVPEFEGAHRRITSGLHSAIHGVISSKLYKRNELVLHYLFG
jgi:hypothetical protein